MSAVRERLNNRRGSIRFSIRHDGAAYLVTLGKFSDGRIAQIFLDAAKPDSALAVHASDAAVLASLLMQHGVAAEVIRRSISGPLATALALAEDRPNRVKRSLLSSASANLSEATVSPRPRFRRIGQWPQGACSPAVAIRGTTHSSSTVVRSCPPADGRLST
jgi:hypothetical protein